MLVAPGKNRTIVFWTWHSDAELLYLLERLRTFTGK